MSEVLVSLHMVRLIYACNYQLEIITVMLQESGTVFRPLIYKCHQLSVSVNLSMLVKLSPADNCLHKVGLAT